MTPEEAIAARKEAIHQLFLLTDEEEVKEYVLAHHRGEVARPSEEMRARCEVTDHELLGRKWYRLAPKAGGQGDPAGSAGATVDGATGADNQAGGAAKAGAAKAGAAKGKTSKILYLHGGGFVLESATVAFDYAEYIMKKTDAEIWFPEYHLAPEHTCLEALAMVRELYRLMLAETPAEEIAFMGDSAGGGLALSAAMLFREEGLPMPNQLICNCPVVEFEPPTDPDEIAYQQLTESRDPMISFAAFPAIGRLWRGDLAADDYRATPIFGRTDNLPPMLVLTGTGEAMNLSIRHFARKAAAEGANIRFCEKEMMNHCWILFPDTDHAAERALIVDRLNHLHFD